MPYESNAANPAYERFVGLLTQYEPQLRRFVRTLLPEWGDVDEVMQRTAIAAWRKFEQLDAGSNFLRWVLIVARFEALAFRRSMARERLVFSEELMELMANEAAEETELASREERALDSCLSKLRPERRELVVKAYASGVDQRDLAEALGRSHAALYMLLSRIRQELARCIENMLQGESLAQGSPPESCPDATARYLHGTATANDLAELELRLMEAPDARVQFRKAARMDANLRKYAPLEGSELRAWERADGTNAALEGTKVRHLSFWHLLGVAACVALSTVVVMAFRMKAPSLAVEAESNEYVATVLSASSIQGSSGMPLRTGSRLPPGGVSFTGGSAEIRFDGGAILLFEGAEEFHIETRSSLRLKRGNVLFRSDATADPFRLRTPYSVFIDTGTEYAALVRDADEELHVLDGEVRRTSPTDAKQLVEVSTAGMARRYTNTKTPGSAIALDSSLAKLGQRPEALAMRAPLLAYDSFVYKWPIATGQDRNGGGGWKSKNWIPTEGMPPVGFDDQHGLQRFGTETLGGSVRTTGRTAMHRYLEKPIHLNKDGVYYFSFLFKRAPVIQNGDTNMLMLVLRKSRQTVDGEIAQQSFVRTSVRFSNAVAAIDVHGVTSRASLPLAADTTYLFVGKIAASQSLPAQAFIRIYAPQDIVPATDPADWSVASEPVYTDLVLNQVSLEFDTKAEVWLDEFKLGESWAAVTQ